MSSSPCYSIIPGILLVHSTPYYPTNNWSSFTGAQIAKDTESISILIYLTQFHPSCSFPLRPFN